MDELEIVAELQRMAKSVFKQCAVADERHTVGRNSWRYVDVCRDAQEAVIILERYGLLETHPRYPSWKRFRES